jgi:hypothetical protein
LILASVSGARCADAPVAIRLKATRMPSRIDFTVNLREGGLQP